MFYVRLERAFPLATLPHFIRGIMKLVLKSCGVWNRHMQIERIFKLSKIFQLIFVGGYVGRERATLSVVITGIQFGGGTPFIDVWSCEF
jgi:hypothetical protein